MSLLTAEPSERSPFAGALSRTRMFTGLTGRHLEDSRWVHVLASCRGDSNQAQTEHKQMSGGDEGDDDGNGEALRRSPHDMERCCVGASNSVEVSNYSAHLSAPRSLPFQASLR